MNIKIAIPILKGQIKRGPERIQFSSSSYFVLLSSPVDNSHDPLARSPFCFSLFTTSRTYVSYVYY
jgi:hypothetical protein